MTPLILAALKEELEPLRRAIPQERVRFMRTGVGPERAGKVVRARCTPGSLLISTGCCGGLVEGAVRGMLAVPDRVIWLQEAGVRPAPDPDRTLATAARAVCERLGLHCSPRPLVTVEHALHTPDSKRRCHEATGAVAVDMETAAIAEAAHDLGLAYLSIRVVLDPANEVLPRPPDLRDPEGKLSATGVLDAASRPRDMLAFATLAFRLRTISRDLARCIALLIDEI